MKKTMDQHRAAWAWAQTPENPSKEYVSLAEGMPATILMCGLGQTTAFYLAKGKKERYYLDLLSNIASWLIIGYKGDDPNGENKQGKKGTDLLAEIMREDRDRYHTLTDEVLDYLIWLKRFAKARE